MAYTPLPKSYKKMFPFKLSTTSYIYPDHILPNVTMLAPFLDEIELVLFESEGEDNFPDEAQIKGLMELSLLDRIGFNIHLPIDVSLGDESEKVRAKGVSIVRRMIQKTLCLNPSFYVLHLDLLSPHFSKGGAGKFVEETDIETWRRRLLRSVEEMAQHGVELNRIAVETLGYPFKWIEDIVEESGFSTCLDIGHVLISGQDLGFYLDKYLPRTSIIHLHGFQKGIDHLAIDRLPGPALKLILSHLRDYHGIVSLEVFSLDDLKRSLFTLEEKWREE
jgi:sugar phosphate isomerase/epimerase